MGQDLDFATLIGSRICHDLISPIGAINNGIELLEMSTSSAGPEMSLISESVSNASARIRFFRIAFGAAGGESIGRPEVVSILNDVYTGSRMSVAWGPLQGIPRRIVRLSFLAVMCLETAMPYGGRVEITEDGDHILLTAIADKMKIDSDLWGLMETAQTRQDLRPAHVQFGLLPVVAESETRALEISTSETRITIRI
ncbi:MAG: histidine phosphotransferase family protein [Sulfitobacter sp.]